MCVWRGGSSSPSSSAATPSGHSSPDGSECPQSGRCKPSASGAALGGPKPLPARIAAATPQRKLPPQRKSPPQQKSMRRQAENRGQRRRAADGADGAGGGAATIKTWPLLRRRRPAPARPANTQAGSADRQPRLQAAAAAATAAAAAVKVPSSSTAVAASPVWPVVVERVCRSQLDVPRQVRRRWRVRLRQGPQPRARQRRRLGRCGGARRRRRWRGAGEDGRREYLEVWQRNLHEQRRLF